MWFGALTRARTAAQGSDIARWQGLLNDVTKARAALDAPDSVRAFGPIVVDFDDVRNLVRDKYDLLQVCARATCAQALRTCMYLDVTQP